jgi:hypothetical protein
MKSRKENKQIVVKYGTMWPRNDAQISRVPKGSVGVYILFDGSMPVYVGKGNIPNRIKRARRSKKRKELWDRFSWYAFKEPRMVHDIEVLVLRMLPRHLRVLTSNEGNFIDAKRVTPAKDMNADLITRKWRANVKGKPPDRRNK